MLQQQYSFQNSLRSKKVGFVCFNESPLKWLKCFFFFLKVLFVLKILNFCPNIFGLVGKGLDKKAKVNFKTYDNTRHIDQ